MTALERRDVILESLRASFRCKVAEIMVREPASGLVRAYALQVTESLPAGVEVLLREVANNAAHAVSAIEQLEADGDGITRW